MSRVDTRRIDQIDLQAEVDELRARIVHLEASIGGLTQE